MEISAWFRKTPKQGGCTRLELGQLGGSLNTQCYLLHSVKSQEWFRNQGPMDLPTRNQEFLPVQSHKLPSSLRCNPRAGPH